MTNSELIAALAKFPPDAEVLFDLGDDYITVETVDCSDPEKGDEICAVFLIAADDSYHEEEVNGVFQRFIGE